jgi:folate-binding protein YgfZ
MTGYQALRERAALLDLDSRGRFRVRGEDRARLLHAMCTNHIQQMQPGDTCYAFFLNAVGRILGDVNVLCLDDHFLLDTEPETHEILYQHLDKYIIADDVVLEDAREDLCALGVEGPEAADMHFEDVLRVPFATTAAGIRLYVPREEKEDWVAKLESMGIESTTAAYQKVVRLERFRPRYGDDITEKNLIHETQLLHGVHFTKGCYLGQEIVERVRSRGQVHRMLVPVYVDSNEAPEAGSQVKAGETAAGETMSSAFSPALGKSVAFAYVRSEHASPGTKLRVNDAEAEVAAAKGV